MCQIFKDFLYIFDIFIFLLLVDSYIFGAILCILVKFQLHFLKFIFLTKKKSVLPADDTRSNADDMRTWAIPANVPGAFVRVSLSSVAAHRYPPGGSFPIKFCVTCVMLTRWNGPSG